jgi:hypothetical protein
MPANAGSFFAAFRMNIVGKFACAAFLVGVLVMFTGCMEALHTETGTPTTPSLFTTITATSTSSSAMNNATNSLPTSASSVQNIPTAPVTPTVLVPTVSPVPNTQEPTRTIQLITPTAGISPTVLLHATMEPLSPTATATPAVTIVAPTLPRLSPEERWRKQQTNRQTFSELRRYETTMSELWWYDPINQQHVVIGTLIGVFDAQATFTLTTSNTTAFEVPYHIGVSYGLTAISSSLIERMNAAGYTTWVETYVIETPHVTPYDMHANE